MGSLKSPTCLSHVCPSHLIRSPAHSSICAPVSAVVRDDAAARPAEEIRRPDVEANRGAAQPEEPPHGATSRLKQESIFTSDIISGYVQYGNLVRFF